MPSTWDRGKSKAPWRLSVGDRISRHSTRRAQVGLAVSEAQVPEVLGVQQVDARNIWDDQNVGCRRCRTH